MKMQKNHDLSFKRNHRLNNEKSQNIASAEHFKKTDLIVKMTILPDYKTIFNNKFQELFSNFYENDCKPNIQKLNKEGIAIFDDYISYPKTKLRNNDEEINLTLEQLKKEVEHIISNITKIMDIKIQNLNAKIEALLYHTNQKLFEIEAKIENGYVKNEVDKDKELKFDDFANPLAKALGGIGVGLGAIIGIGVGVGLAETVSVGLLCGTWLGAAGAGIGAIIGLVKYGIYKISKEFHKEEDLVELVQKGKTTFTDNVNNYYNILKSQLEEYKNKIILEVNTIIDNKMFELQKELDTL